MSNIGVLHISYDQLAGILGLPKGHTVIAIVPPDAHAIANQSFSVMVSGPQLPEHAGGSHPMHVGLNRDGRGRVSFT